MRELKEEGLMEVEWTAGLEMPADILTKNLGGSLFEKHRDFYVS
jgi:hypothetical protein